MFVGIFCVLRRATRENGSLVAQLWARVPDCRTLPRFWPLYALVTVYCLCTCLNLTFAVFSFAISLRPPVSTTCFHPLVTGYHVAWRVSYL